MKAQESESLQLDEATAWESALEARLIAAGVPVMVDVRWALLAELEAC
jgi:hypothetical protein